MKKLLLIAALLSMAGCATTYTNNAELLGTRYHRTALDTYPLIVSSVDGRSTPVRQRIWVEPGMRDIVVEDPLQAGRTSAAKHITLDVQPCTRYYLVAVKESRRSNDYEVKVDYVEPLEGGCKG